MQLEDFREKLEKKQFVYGPFMKSMDPAFVEVVGHAGYDFAILDMEHGPTDFSALQNLIRAAECSGILPIVRVSKLDEVCIARALDVGAKGVQVPQIESAEEAVRAVEYAKYSPDGNRGVCRFVRAANYSATDRFEYFREANRNLVILQLEGCKPLEDIDAILEVKGCDIIFIGPYDLSQSLGVAGQVDHPLVEEKMSYIVDKATAKGVVVGTFVDNIPAAQKWKNLGVRYISYSVDVGIFYEACLDIRKSLYDD